jgi:aminoglycoside phosphotransferase (APT) family kinase protein
MSTSPPLSANTEPILRSMRPAPTTPIVSNSTEARVLALLDWELSTLGDPIADLAYHTITWRIPPSLLRGLGGLDLAALGIPDEDTYSEAILRPHWI